MTIKYSDLVASTQEKIDSDVDFQNTLVDLSDDDKNQAIADKQQELLDSELAALEAKAVKAEEIASNQKIRAEKAEALAKGPKLEKETPKNESVSIQDVVALRDVHEADVDWLVQEAKLRNKTVLEMKADPYTKIILQTRAEERKTAEATNTGSGRKTNSRSDEATLIKKAEGSKLSDDEMPSAAKSIINEVFGKR